MSRPCLDQACAAAACRSTRNFSEGPHTLDHEAESVPVNVRFCWRYETFSFFFPLKDSPGDQCAASHSPQSFAVKDSPIWMDASTAEQCQRLEARLRGAQAVAAITGSRAYERFSGNQIAYIRDQCREDYDGSVPRGLRGGQGICRIIKNQWGGEGANPLPPSPDQSDRRGKKQILGKV